ncbi:MAG: superoxide dismutase family protein [Myxococcota bacterium]|nr:superoxide dismutase family protein [Myxococcota bacterium]
MKICKKIVFSSFLACACAALQQADDETVDNSSNGGAEKEASKEKGPASAVLAPIGDSLAYGMVEFIPEEGQVRIAVEIYGLEQGSYNYHVLTLDDCAQIDTYEHNDNDPSDNSIPRTELPIQRDLGTIEAEDNGIAEVAFVDDHLSMEDLNSIIGRALAVFSGDQDADAVRGPHQMGPAACGVITRY